VQEEQRRRKRRRKRAREEEEERGEKVECYSRELRPKGEEIIGTCQ
jgi:hypothetical protein